MTDERDGDVKERILDASINLFLVYGFAGTPVKKITDAAGVAKGTLYWHFASKETILEEIIDKFSREMYDEVMRRVAGCEGGFEEKFKTLYKFITEFAREQRGLLLVCNTLLGELVGSGVNAEAKIKAVQMRFHKFLADLLKRGQKEGVVKKDLDANIQAHIIIANFIGMHLQWCLHGDAFDAAEYARAYRDEILCNLGVEDGGRRGEKKEKGRSVEERKEKKKISP
jgi:TetR/AcrR family transcriptional regulator